MATNLIPRNGSACRDQRGYEDRLRTDLDFVLQELAYGPWSQFSLGGGINEAALAARSEIQRRRSIEIQSHEWARIQREGFGQ
jgi:hypothetical protein